MVTVMNDELIAIRKECLEQAIRSGVWIKDAADVVDRAKEFEKYILRAREETTDGK